MLRGAIIDLDGTVYVGEDILDGARVGIEMLNEAGVDLLFLSNNPVKSGQRYIERLIESGLDVSESEAYSSGDVTVSYLHDHHDDDRILCIGSEGLCDQLQAVGLELVDSPPCDVVIASWTAGFDYDDMRRTLAAADDDTVFLGTDPDRTYQATGDVLVPGSGAIIGALAATLGRDPDAILGKPSAVTRNRALARLGHSPEECLVVGDRLDTDLAMGERAGMTTALVLTGVTERQDVEDSPVQPDYVLEDLGEVDRVLDDFGTES